MYNRYIPQSDGSFQKQTCTEGKHEPPSPKAPSPPPKPPEKHTDSRDAGTAIHQLLPADFDTEDLIIVLLLLLMSGESSEGKNTALLTMVLYLFL